MRPLFNGFAVLWIGASLQACISEPATPSRSDQDAVTAAGESKVDRRYPELALFTPTETDMWRQRAAVLEHKLGRMTQIADAFVLGSHLPTGDETTHEQSIDQEFLAAFRAGEYGRIDELMGRFAALIPDGDLASASPKVIARLGFLNIWRFAERYRMLAPGAEFPTEVQAQLQETIGTCAGLFQAAVQAQPHNAVYRGFAAICTLMLGQGTDSIETQVKGLELAIEAVRGNPEFNLFTLGYVLTAQPLGTRQFSLGVEMLWRNLDVCFDDRVSRSNPDVSKYLKSYVVVGNKPYCLNSAIAPHNFEGFFLVFGDALLKAGKPAIAKTMYANAKLSASYQHWPLRATLEQRIANADSLALVFAEPVNMTRRPAAEAMVFDSTDNCMVCHQQ